MLIKCPECQNDVSDTAAACPCCGYSDKQKKSLLGKLSFVLAGASSLLSFAPKKKTLVAQMSPLQFFVYALNNVEMDQDGFEKRVRDYSLCEATGTTNEYLVEFGLCKFISSEIVRRLFAVENAAFDASNACDGVKLIKERDVDPYVENLLPFFSSLFSVTMEVRALSSTNLKTAGSLTERFVRDLLAYEDTEYRFARKLIPEREHWSNVEALVNGFSASK